MMNKTIELLSKQTKKMMWTYLPRYIFGGGHPLPALFCPTIRVPLRSDCRPIGAKAP